MRCEELKRELFIEGIPGYVSFFYCFTYKERYGSSCRRVTDDRRPGEILEEGTFDPPRFDKHTPWNSQQLTMILFRESITLNTKLRR